MPHHRSRTGDFAGASRSLDETGPRDCDFARVRLVVSATNRQVEGRQDDDSRTVLHGHQPHSPISLSASAGSRLCNLPT